ncbi:MAG: cyclase family protein [Actinomycetes bacterium]
MKLHKIVDLSRVINSDTQVYPGDPQPRFTPYTTIEHDGFNVLNIEMGSQSGTHVDAPFHFDADTARITEVSLDHFVGQGIIVDVRNLSPRSEITWDLIAPQVTHAVSGDIVLLHTGWSQYYGTDEYFNHPYLTADACAKLIAQGVHTFGIDAINLDETPDDTHDGVGFPVHHLIADVGGIISENLCNLHEIDFAQPLISLLPIKLDGADGAPVRAVAMQFA